MTAIESDDGIAPEAASRLTVPCPADLARADLRPPKKFRSSWSSETLIGSISAINTGNALSQAGQINSIASLFESKCFLSEPSAERTTVTPQLRQSQIAHNAIMDSDTPNGVAAGESTGSKQRLPA